MCWGGLVGTSQPLDHGEAAKTVGQRGVCRASDQFQAHGSTSWCRGRNVISWRQPAMLILLILTVGTVSARQLYADRATAPQNKITAASSNVQLVAAGPQQQDGQQPAGSSRSGAGPVVTPTQQPGRSLPRALRQQYTDAIDVLSPELLEHLQPANGTFADMRAVTAAIAAANSKQVQPKFAYPAPSVLARDEAEESVVFLGEKFRLRRVMRDLQAGRSVSIGVVGGSISWGAGLERGVQDWFARVVTTLQRVYPRSTILSKNGCMLAAKMTFLSLCLEQHVDDDVDMVFLEYQPVGPWGARDRHHMALERLLRKLLQKPHAPAVVLLQLPSLATLVPGAPAGKEDEEETEPSNEVSAMQLYASTYDVPYLRLRAPIWRVNSTAHPSLGQTLRRRVSQGLVQGHGAIADAVLNMLSRCSEDMELLMGWSGWDEENYARALGAPVHPDNYEEVNKICWGGTSLASIVMASRNWELVNDGSKHAKRMAYVAQQPGAELLLSLDTMSRTDQPDIQVNVRLAYIRSGLQRMGRVLVQCTSGCFCKPMVLDGNRETGRPSALYLAPMRMSQAPSCRVLLHLLPGTTSGGHLFKLAAVLVDEPGGSNSAPAADWHQTLAWVQEMYQRLAPGGQAADTDAITTTPTTTTTSSSSFSSSSSSSVSHAGQADSGVVNEIQDYQQQERQQLEAEGEEQQLARDATSQQQADHVVFRGSAQDSAQLEHNLQQHSGHAGWHWLAWHRRLPPHHEAEELRRSTQVPATL